MIKKNALRRICIATLVLIIIFIIYLFPKSDNIKESITYKSLEEIPIFLLDHNNYVARTSIIKKSNTLEEEIKDIISSLTIGSETYIKNGFSPVIPEGTILLDLDINDNTLTLNFSKEFLNIDSSKEESMLEAIIYSLLEFKEFNKIKIYVDNKQVDKYPEYFDKSYGINKIYNITNYKNTSKTTIYYLSKYDNYYYYVPITKISNDNIEKVEIIIKELKTTPIYHTNLISYLASSSNLTNYELLEEEVIMSFDNDLIYNISSSTLKEEVKYSIALSLRDTYGIYNVTFNLPNESIKLSL